MGKKTFLLLGLLMALMSSCNSYNTAAPVFGYDQNCIKTNVTAELDITNIKEKYKKIETRVLFGIIQFKHNNDHRYLKSSSRYRSLTKSESQLLYKAKQNSSADIIFDLEFTSEKHSWFFGSYKTTKITVDG